MKKSRTPFGWLMCLVILGGFGCRVPMPYKVTSGQRYSKDALHFLDLPDTTREEVVATLGPPLVEVTEARVLLYSWETTKRRLLIVPDGLRENGHSTEYGNSQEWGLFIGYSDRGTVTAHEVKKIKTFGLEETCVKWATSKGLK